MEDNRYSLAQKRAMRNAESLFEGLDEFRASQEPEPSAAATTVSEAPLQAEATASAPTKPRDPRLQGMADFGPVEPPAPPRVRPALSGLKKRIGAYLEQVVSQCETVSAKVAAELPLPILKSSVAPAAEIAASAAVAEANPAPLAEPVHSGPDLHDRMIREIPRGAWIEFTRSSGISFRARLNWISPNGGLYVFTNQAGERALTLSADSLANQFRHKRARILPEVVQMATRQTGSGERKIA